jgi:branched-chain amino acid transport system permease protein
MTHVVQIIFDGVVIGSTYALVALGFTLVFGVVGVMNVAHSDFYMLGAYVSLWIGTNAGLGTVVGVLAAIAAGAGAGLLLYLVILRQLSQEQMMAVFIATLGLSFFIQNFVARFVGPDTVASTPLFHSSFHSVGGIAVSDAQMLLLAATAVLGVGLVKWIGLSGIGRSMRAVAENGPLARMVGINVAMVLVVTVMVASAIAALGGVLVTNVTQTVSPFLSNEIALKMFIVAMVAGAGSVGGAVIAGVGLGIVESFAVAYLGSSWQHIAGFAILVAILMVRPRGLFGKVARVG